MYISKYTLKHTWIWKHYVEQKKPRPKKKKKKNDPIYMKFNHKQSSSMLTEAIMVGTWQGVGTDWWGAGEVFGETVSLSE